MKFFSAAGALLLALMMPACADASTEGAGEEARFCSVLLAEGAAYATSHADHREERMQIMRFASEEAMNVYIAETEALRGVAAEFTEMHTALKTQYDLPGAAEAYSFDETSDDAAANRIEFARECAAALIE